MNDLGKRIRLNRIFRYRSHRILAVDADRMISRATGMPQLINTTVTQIVEAQPSSITLNKGVTKRCESLSFAGTRVLCS